MLKINNIYNKVFLGIIFSLSLTTAVYFLSGKRDRKEHSVAQMYDKDDLSACCLFAGHFINFGYWERSKEKGSITVSERIESQKNLYRLVAKALGISQGDRVLEVACGLGVGSVLVATEFNPQKIDGIDFSSAQISRAQKINSEFLQVNLDKISFQRGAAEEIPFAANQFEKLYSIEAVQHFEDLDQFAKEAHRVLKPKGSLAVASFFGTSEQSYSSLSPLIQTIRDGIDHATPIHQFEEILKKNGFVNVKVESIGKNVWHGFDQWTAQGELKNSWTRNWYKGYQNGFIDYYLITAEKE